MKFELKAGKYLVIDPCYCVPDEDWSDLCACFEYVGFKKQKGNCSSLTPVDQREGLEMFYKGQRFVVIGTAHGDGGFSLKQSGRHIAELSVDAGLLSVIPLELAQSWPEFNEKNDLGAIIEVKYNTTLTANGGDFKFGQFSVKTGDEDNEEIS